MKAETLTGPDLKALRRKAGINQSEMAAMIGTSRHTISYWEIKRTPFRRCDLRWGKPAKMLKALGVELPDFSRITRARGDGVLGWRDWQQEALDREMARLRLKVEAKLARRRVKCGAKTRKGHPCRLLSEPGKHRCKFHGGMSTVPRTPEGKARISEAQRRRWANFHRRLY